MAQPLSSAEQMPGGACVHQRMQIHSPGKRWSQRAAHNGKTADELGERELELADEYATRRSYGKAQTVRAGRQRQSEVGDQQRLTDFGLTAYEQDALQRQ